MKIHKKEKTLVPLWFKRWTTELRTCSKSEI